MLAMQVTNYITYIVCILSTTCVLCIYVIMFLIVLQFIIYKSIGEVWFNKFMPVQDKTC